MFTGGGPGFDEDFKQIKIVAKDGGMSTVARISCLGSRNLGQSLSCTASVAISRSI